MPPRVRPTKPPTMPPAFVQIIINFVLIVCPRAMTYEELGGHNEVHRHLKRRLWYALYVYDTFAKLAVFGRLSPKRFAEQLTEFANQIMYTSRLFPTERVTKDFEFHADRDNAKKILKRTRKLLRVPPPLHGFQLWCPIGMIPINYNIDQSEVETKKLYNYICLLVPPNHHIRVFDDQCMEIISRYIRMSDTHLPRIVIEYCGPFIRVEENM
jgi:hypothetical protein